MNSISKMALTLIASFLFCISTKAQNQDYVITNAGDTIKCEIISASANSRTFKYQTAGMKLSKPEFHE